MTLKADILSDIDDIFFDVDDFAESVTYTPKGGAPAVILAIVDFGENLKISGKTVKEAASVTVKASDVPTPKYKDTVEINSELYTVERSPQGAGGVWVLDIRKGERSAFGG
ncbi:hypothetical protein KAR91_70265 [Candidatus Pacearchaeota archaeon]|nr:hypothetical protein [Candidatus Pacearchaeota archaeon]